jgi:hypothetical protein
MNNTRKQPSQYSVEKLMTLSKKELLILCEGNSQVFKLCNDNPQLYKKITTPDPLE